MKPVLALIARDLQLATRAGGDILTLVLFFVMVGVIVPFAVGPDKALLARLAPGIVWMAAFLSLLLGLDRLFRADHEDGSLLGFRQATISLEAIVSAKLLAHWVTTGLPVILATPLLAVMLNMDGEGLARALLSLLFGTPGLVGFGVIGAALTVTLRRGGLVAPVLVLPLSIPILIFGVSAISTEAGPEAERAALLFLAGISLLASALSPFVAALALRMAAE